MKYAEAWKDVVIEFQPFLRFWCRSRYIETLDFRPQVSTLLEILAPLHYAVERNDYETAVSTLLEILVDTSAYRRAPNSAMFQPFLRFWWLV